MHSNLVSFIQMLRSHEVRVSPAETLDAVEVAAALGYADRELLRDGLAMTLAKTAEEEVIFLQCFERFFKQNLADFAAPEQADSEQADATLSDENTETFGDNFDGSPENALEQAEEDSPALRSLMQGPLMQNLLNNERNELTLAMNQAAQQVDLQQIQMFTQKGQFTRRILDAMGEEQIRRAIIELEQAGNPILPLLQRYRDMLREQVRDYVEREYLLHAEGKTQQFMDEILSKTRLNNIEHVYVGKVQNLIRKMAKKLANQYSRKRKQVKRGQLDMPKTLRKGIPNDGVMFNTYWRQVKKDKPQVLAVCDVSGSVAA